MIHQIFIFFFLSERLFLPLFWRSKQRNNLLNLRPLPGALLIPPFYILPLENRRLIILKTSGWLIGLRAFLDALDVDWFKLRCTPPIWPYLEEKRCLSKKILKYSSRYVHSWPVILVRFLWRGLTSLKLFIMLSVRTAFRSQARR